LRFAKISAELVTLTRDLIDADEALSAKHEALSIAEELKKEVPDEMLITRKTKGFVSRLSPKFAGTADLASKGDMIGESASGSPRDWSRSPFGRNGTRSTTRSPIFAPDRQHISLPQNAIDTRCSELAVVQSARCWQRNPVLLVSLVERLTLESLMRLADFILHNTEAILREWEIFARRIWPPTATDPAELRDHAQDILRATARDMRSAQTSSERAAKSTGEGKASDNSTRLDDASMEHGLGRVASGFKLKELVAEYRALRASVIRLWRASAADPNLLDLDDLTRFNESIDQSLAQAVDSFTERVDQSRQLFLAILGHDLRNPLNAVQMSAQMLTTLNPAHKATVETAGVIASSTTAMSRMITDLLDFTGSGLGGGLPVDRVVGDLNAVCREVLDESRAAHPECNIRYESSGDLTGQWDAARVRQVVSNLVGNAVQHGASTCEIRLVLRGERSEIFMSVHNDGPAIVPEALHTIFDPLVRVVSAERRRQRRPGSIGLGLYIVREVIKAHGGTIDVTSTEQSGTTFTARFPRASVVKRTEDKLAAAE
jgi:signal transduction histidine kinase